MSPKFRIYTKPDCGHCQRAKNLLDEKRVGYEAITLLTKVEQQTLLARLVTHNTFPVIFELNEQGQPVRFIGGADALQQFVAGG